MLNKSLADLMEEAYTTSLEVAYGEIAPDGHYLTPRKGLTKIESDLVFGWVDTEVL